MLFKQLYLILREVKRRFQWLTGDKIPEGVENRSVGEDTDEAVLNGDVVQEGLLGVHNEGVRDPEELHQPAVQAQALVALEDQALIRPTLPQEDSGGVVLHVRLRKSTHI